ncbi:MAG: aminopeptidase [Myxococcota bacterium]
MHRALFALSLLVCLVASGCDYAHLAAGQLKILWHRRPLAAAVQDPRLPPDDRALLARVDSVRAFARALGLRVGNQYTSFVEWPGDRIVTTLVRTRPGSLETVGWWYPFLGRLPYRGYFDQVRAEREARRLRERQGYDVCVSAVTAYSTLGWLDDPVTSPMLGRGAANLVETLLHELVHATVFVDGDADFNEGVALFVGQEAAIRYFESIERERAAQTAADDERVARADEAGAAGEARSREGASPLPSAERVRAWVEDRRRIEATVLRFRERVEAIAGRPDAAVQRAAAERVLRGELAALPLEVIDPGAIAAETRLSDACLALRGTYFRDVPRHAALLAAEGGDLRVWIGRLIEWAKRDEPPARFFSDAFFAARPASGATPSAGLAH